MKRFTKKKNTIKMKTHQDQCKSSFDKNPAELKNKCLMPTLNNSSTLSFSCNADGVQIPLSWCQEAIPGEYKDVDLSQLSYSNGTSCAKAYGLDVCKVSLGQTGSMKPHGNHGIQSCHGQMIPAWMTCPN